MTPLYVEEHLNCYLYDSANEIINHIEKDRGESFVFCKDNTHIFFVVNGRVKFAAGYLTNSVLEAGDFILIPRKQESVIAAEEKSNMIMLKLHHKVNFCDHFPLEMLYELNKERIQTTNSSLVLSANKIVNDWLNIVVQTTVGGLKCTFYQELKQKEICFFLRAYYSKEELFAFFSPILNSDMRFSNLIYEKYMEANSVEELAELTNYSLSGFKKKFVSVFGCSPALWIAREKAKKIYHEINSTQKSFKEIVFEYDFSSQAHFDRFCKKMYNMSPGVLRRNTRDRVLFNGTKTGRFLQC
ncbi:MAG: helix-turn-helix transcriptional regulator [Bacteroidetes bacterium]|nr:helix-turn-helix transcriptional regulator [Bacteroidota bacterium]